MTQEPRKDEGYEELVEEIARRIISQFGLVRGSITAHNLARRYIALVLQAVGDGEVKLPNEVGRYSNKGKLTGAEWIMEMHLRLGAREFIALRPKGKAEEKGGDVE